MNLIVNRASRIVARALHRAGLEPLNRIAKAGLKLATSDSLTIEVDGFRIRGGIDSWTILNQLKDGSFEPYERDLFVGALRPGMIVLDVGANLGYYALLAARAVGPAGTVLAFEPHPRTSRDLRANLATNAAENTRVYETAVSDHSDPRTLYLSRTATHTGLHRSMDDSDPAAVTVSTVRVDDLDLGHVDVVKMDIEGEEPAALSGMRRTLDASPEAQVFLEFSPHSLAAAGHDPAEVARSLMTRFREVVVIDERARETQPLRLPLTGERLNLWCRHPC